MPSPTISLILRGGKYTTLDPDNKGSLLTLSNRNLTATTAATSTSNKNTARSKASVGASTQRFEINCNQLVTHIGLANSSFNLSSGDLGNSSTNSIGMFTDGTWYINGVGQGASGIGTWTAGDLIGIEVNGPAQTIRAIKNGGAAGNSISYATLTGTLYAAATLVDGATATSLTANFGASSWGTIVGAGYLGIV